MKITGTQTMAAEIEISEAQRKGIAIGVIEEAFNVHHDWDYESALNRMTEQVEYHTSHSYYVMEVRVEKPTTFQIDALKLLHLLTGRAIWGTVTLTKKGS